MQPKYIIYEQLSILMMVTSFVHGTRWIIFVKRSTSTSMAVLPSDSSKPVTKSIVIYCQALSGIGIGYRTQAFFLLSVFML